MTTYLSNGKLWPLRSFFTLKSVTVFPLSLNSIWISLNSWPHLKIGDIRTLRWRVWCPNLYSSLTHNSGATYPFYVTKWEADWGKSLDDSSSNKIWLDTPKWPGEHLQAPLQLVYDPSVGGEICPLWWSCLKAIRFWAQIYSLIRSVLNILLACDPWEALLHKLIPSLTKAHRKLQGFVFPAAGQTLARAWQQPFLNFAEV